MAAFGGTCLTIRRSSMIFIIQMRMSTVFQHVRTFLDQQPIVARTLERSSSPNILFSQLPKHWRSNKSFQDQFVVVLLTPVPDNTEVSIWAGNDEAPCGEIRNEKAKIHRQVAKFNDLRFVGRSGRGRKFHITIVIHSSPMMVATVKNVIKVTVDGPREARIPKPSTCSRRSSDPNFPLDLPTTSMLPQLMPTPLWPWPMPVPQIMTTSPFFQIIPTTSCQTQFPTTLPLPSNLLPNKRRSLITMTKSHTPVKVEQENESLNTSTSASSPTSFLTAPSPGDRQLKRSPKPSPSSISLTQCTPESVPTKRRRNESTTSSNSSSPTIWRPF